jgi:hypothetical protein
MFNIDSKYVTLVITRKIKCKLLIIYLINNELIDIYINFNLTLTRSNLYLIHVNI